MLRIGGEIRQKKLSLRAGYYAEESSIKNNDNSHYGSSFGIGYDFKNGSIISLSLVSSNINLVNSLSSSGINDSFTSNTKRNSISMSYNLKL